MRVLNPIKSGISRRYFRNPISPGSFYYDGIHLDFQRDFHYVKTPAGVLTRAPFTSLFTFTGDNKSMYRGANGLLRASETNTPRIEYDASGNLLGLLVEGARTNLCLQSADFTTTWTIGGTTRAANATTAPDGTATADSLTDDDATSQHQTLQAITLTAATYTWSVFVKANGQRYFSLYPQGTGVDARAVFDLQAPTAATFTFGAQYLSSGITAYANGWHRAWITYTGTANSISHVLYLSNVNNAAAPSYDGTLVGLYLWGAQVELGAFPSSYIPTTTASVARAADISVRTFGAEYATDKGTTFAQFDTANVALATGMILARDSNSRNLYKSTNSIRIFDGTGPATASGAIVADTTYRAASAFDADGMSACLNGGTIGTAAFDGTWGAGTTIGLGRISAGDELFGHIRRLSYWPERKSNAELQRLTA